jgi:hypothetical protein
MINLTLRGKQSHFVWMLGQLIAWAYAHGYELTIGEATRTDAEALANYQAGRGILRSLHIIRLAVDLNLFIGGNYERDSAAYMPLGLYWESLGGSWGGRFSTPDGNHFSLEHDGIR